mmetsp:Transcript_22810/g.38224  ORF Transcript_22810/g.38224 Transcript_22810/m.38224 type:complete len:499 (+) Transcript_22810:71-1567(+)
MYAYVKNPKKDEKKGIASGVDPSDQNSRDGAAVTESLPPANSAQAGESGDSPESIKASTNSDKGKPEWAKAYQKRDKNFLYSYKLNLCAEPGDLDSSKPSAATGDRRSQSHANFKKLRYDNTKWAEGYDNLLECKTVSEMLVLLSKLQSEMHKVAVPIAREIVDENHNEWRALMSFGSSKERKGRTERERMASQESQRKNSNVPTMSMEEKKRKYVPLDVGGLAGGTKFMAEGFLFKLAVDPVKGGDYLFGGEVPDLDRASKSAAHELHGANAFFTFFLKQGIRIQVPWQKIVDYRGFRVVAMPILPIEGSELVYGSNDGGRTIRNADAAFSRSIQQAAAELHLAKHNVHGTMLWTGGDVEGHRVANPALSLRCSLGSSCSPPSQERAEEGEEDKEEEEEEKEERKHGRKRIYHGSSQNRQYRHCIFFILVEHQALCSSISNDDQMSSDVLIFNTLSPSSSSSPPTTIIVISSSMTSLSLATHIHTYYYIHHVPYQTC